MNFSLKAKELIFNSAHVRYFIFVFLAFIFVSRSVQAQVEQRIKPPAGALPVKADTLRPDSLVISRDSVSLPPDSLSVKNDSIPPAKGDIETTINYSAKDSIQATLDGKMIWLYGDAKIKYGEIELEADEITIDYGNNTLTAHGRRDSLGQRVGYPIFKNGAEMYETKDIIYNFKTKRARISEVVTQQGEGYLSSEAAFKNEKNEILSIHNSYTTCNLEHPHFRIRATKTKAIPNDKIVAGPFYMEFNDIPLPLGFLFGMFPAQRSSASGIIFPSYGEESRRGFNLRHGGYFFDISEYMKLAVTGDIYSRGGHALYLNSTYMKRYHYNGSFNFTYSRNPDTDDKIETTSYTKDFRITWSHSPQSKGTGRFAASVNAATNSFTQNNNLMYGNPNELTQSGLSQISSTIGSNISYNKTFSGTPFSMGINMTHSQNLQTKLVDLQLPSLSVNMQNLYPFQKKSGATGPLDNFSFGYSMTASNRVTNNLGRIPTTATKDSILTFNSANIPYLLENAKKGIRHTIPLSYSFKAFRFFTVSPSISWEEKWYTEKYKWGYNEAGSLVRTDTVKGFNRIGNGSLSVGLTTRIYGMYISKNPSRKVKAIRHVMNPSVSFGYTPDYRYNTNYFQQLPTRINGEDDPSKPIFQSVHDGSLYGGSSTGHSSSIGFSLGNNLEMKVQGKEDSVARKVMLLNNLSLSTSYNLIAYSFNLAPISMAANTNVLNNLINMNFSATLDPYTYNNYVNSETGLTVERREKALAWQNQKIGRITSASLALSSNLNPKARSKETSSREKIGKSNLPEQEKQYLLKNPNAYIDFDIPWSLNLSYNLAYSHGTNSKPAVNQTAQGSGDLSLSEKWKVTYSTGYDFKASQFTQTSLGISRDLHCWTMHLNWVPFGRFQSFNFTINVKAAILQDLKLERRKSFVDNL